MTRGLCAAVIGFTLGVLTWPATSLAATSKEVYELQERCGKRSEEFFERYYGNGILNTEDGTSITKYRNHYNTKLNKCFVLLSFQDIPHKDKSKRPSTSMTLLDINENREYAHFFQTVGEQHPWLCEVVDKLCSSQGEWNSLVYPYMEE